MNRGLRNRLIVYFVVGILLLANALNQLSSMMVELKEKTEEKEKLEIGYNDLIEEQVFLEEELVKFDDPEYVLIYAKKNHLFTEKGTIKFKIPVKNNE